MEVGTLRKQLKDWERQFYKEKGKKPSKADIDNCDSIKDFYIRYNKAKEIAARHQHLYNQQLSGLETNTDIKCKGFKIVSAAPKSTPSAVTKRFLSLSQRNPKASSFEQHSTWPDIVIPPWAMSTAENNSKDLHSDSTKTLDIPAISPPPPQGSLTIQKGDWNNGKLAETNDREVPCDSNKRSISDSTFNATQEKEITTKIKKMKTPKYPESTSRIPDANYVRLNMKSRSYKPRGRKMTGAQYKRKMWKKNSKFSNKENTGLKIKRKFGGYQSYSRKNNEKTISKSKILEYPSIVEDDLISNNNIDSENSVKAEKEENSRESELNDIVCYPGLPRPMHIPSTSRESLKPYCTVAEDMDKIIDSSLKEFGYCAFKTGQRKVISRILCGMSTLAILPTGGGKSLCYQLPARLYAARSECITLVISPLVSLMEDQVSKFPPFLKGACLHSNLSQSQRKKVYKQLEDKKISVLLTSPETLVSALNDGERLRTLLPPVAFACIDEIHCVSEWSHHFRPCYLLLCKLLKERLGVKCLLGLTATATVPTINSVCAHLGIANSDDGVIQGITLPENLHISVSCDDRKDNALVTLLNGNRFLFKNSIIIYCTRRDETERIAQLIRSYLLRQTFEDCHREVDLEHAVECYHAGMSPRQRRLVQKNFMSGRTKIVIATVAFGMGLDKADVRGIIHYNMPKTFETFVQEIGRAGRDGLPAHCHVILGEDNHDIRELERHVYANAVEPYTIKRFINMLFPFCDCIQEKKSEVGSRSEDHEPQNYAIGHEVTIPIDKVTVNLDIREEVFKTLLCYIDMQFPGLISILSPIHSVCEIICSDSYWKKLVQTVPIITAAVKLQKIKRLDKRSPCFTFPYVQVADKMGWDYEPVRRELFKLQWRKSNDNTNKFIKSGINVTFTINSFHVRVPCCLSDSDRDNIACQLLGIVRQKEKDSLQNLQIIYAALHSVAYKDCKDCIDTVDPVKSCELQTLIREYFKSQEPSSLLLSKNINTEAHLPTLQVSDSTIDGLRRDICSFLSTYNEKFNGSSIARIFHGIGSPAFPAEVWYRCKRFWRRHMDVDFKTISRVATRELVKWRSC